MMIPRSESLHFCEVHVFGERVTAPSVEFLELKGKPIEDSGVFEDKHATNAVDGMMNTCFQSKKVEEDVWWQVDLHDSYKIESVQLFNPGAK